MTNLGAHKWKSRSLEGAVKCNESYTFLTSDQIWYGLLEFYVYANILMLNSLNKSK